MANINLTSTTGTGFLETDFDQLKEVLQDATKDINTQKLTATQTGTSEGIEIDNSAGSTGVSLNIDNDGTGETVILAAQNFSGSTSNTGSVKHYLGSGTGNAYYIRDTATGQGLKIDKRADALALTVTNSNSATATDTLAKFTNKGTGPAIEIDQNGDGAALILDTASTVQAPLRITNLASDPTGTHVIGDLAVVNGALKICTAAGTPGTWASAGSGITAVLDDTTPQLGGDLDLNDKALTREETAGEILADGDLAYLKSDGKYWKADASAEATADNDLLMCTEAISADATGTFVEYGEYTTTGLTAGSKYYVSETAGAITATAPTTSTAIVRIVGTAISTTVLKFKPSGTYVELA